MLIYVKMLSPLTLDEAEATVNTENFRLKLILVVCTSRLNTVFVCLVSDQKYLAVLRSLYFLLHVERDG